MPGKSGKKSRIICIFAMAQNAIMTIGKSEKSIPVRGVKMVTGKYQFFYDQMPEDAMRSFYMDALAAAQKRQPNFSTSSAILRCKNLSIPNGILYMYGDHPELFDMNIGQYAFSPQFGGKVKVSLFYRETSEAPALREQRLCQAVDGVLKSCFPDGWRHLSPLKREKLLFNYIADHVSYDDDAWEKVKNTPKWTTQDSDAWSAYGALVKGKAVCQGVACAFKLLCEQVDIPCLVVIGTIVKNLERHAWNILRIDGKFYHVDCTWMLRTSIDRNVPFARYQYFNVPDQMMVEERSMEMSYLPECRSMKHNPFYIRGMCATGAEDAAAKLHEQIIAGKERIAVLCVGLQPTQEEASEIMQRAVRATGKSINWYVNGHFLGGYIT